jgi:hypothetical protein
MYSFLNYRPDLSMVTCYFNNFQPLLTFKLPILDQFKERIGLILISDCGNNSHLSRCQFCHKGLNSNYIRVGSKETFKKVGLYCTACDIYYSLDLSKRYTVQTSQNSYYNQNQTGPVGFDPMTCGSEDRRDILTTLRTLPSFDMYLVGSYIIYCDNGW